MGGSRIVMGALAVAILLLGMTVAAIISVLGAGDRATMLPPTATVLPPTATVLPPTATALPSTATVVGATVHADRTGAEYVAVPAGAGIAAFRIMRTEVTIAQYEQCVAAGVCSSPYYPETYCTMGGCRPPLIGGMRYDDHPVLFVEREQARRYAAWVGGKLPSESQWLRACQGDDGRTWPWGERPPDVTRANAYPTGPDYTTPVGSYPAGASPFGVLDMAGNVAEWVESDAGSDELFIMRGGALDTSAEGIACTAADVSTYELGAQIYDSFVGGFRVVSIEPVATTITPDDAPAATALTDRTGADYVPVPAGGEVAAFRIMRTEVTNAQYARCVAAGACSAPVISKDFNDTSRADHPVVGTSRAQARKYAAWVGGRLPAQAQWLRACQGDDGHRYPWGEQAADSSRGQFNRGYFNADYTIAEDYRTAPVGSFPAGASPYGVLDMAGNVWEWIEPDDGNDATYLVYGGAFNSPDRDLTCDAVYAIDGTASLLQGFRVVLINP